MMARASVVIHSLTDYTQNSFTSRDVNFYKAFFSRNKASGKSNEVLQGEEIGDKGFPGLF